MSKLYRTIHRREIAKRKAAMRATIAQNIMDQLNRGEPQIPDGWQQISPEMAHARDEQFGEQSDVHYTMVLVDYATGEVLPPAGQVPETQKPVVGQTRLIAMIPKEAR